MVGFTPYYKSPDGIFTIFKNDCNKILPFFNNSVDLIFADPPYFLSNGGNTIRNGQIVSVNKGDWDEIPEYNELYNYNLSWIKNCRNALKPDGTIWISGTVHNIFSILQALKDAEYKILNVITWQKTNPPPNFYKKIFLQSTEYIVFARKDKKITHLFNYNDLFVINNNKRMSDVWTLPAVQRWEKRNGEHPTQKPLNLLSRIILSATKEGDTILDPFSGSSTTGIAANLLNRKYFGIELSEDYLKYSIKRKQEILNPEMFKEVLSRIKDYQLINKI
jgi:site-specific DNA-methyltransferase (adenine-specific)